MVCPTAQRLAGREGEKWPPLELAAGARVRPARVVWAEPRAFCTARGTLQVDNYGSASILGEEEDEPARLRGGNPCAPTHRAWEVDRPCRLRSTTSGCCLKLQPRLGDPPFRPLWSAAALPSARRFTAGMACIASTRSVAAAARPAAPCSSRVGCAPATPWRPAGSRAPSALQAVAGATPQAAQAPSSTAQPAHVEFPAVAVSRMLHGNRAFVEQHRCAARLQCEGGRAGCRAGLRASSRCTGRHRRASPRRRAGRRRAAPTDAAVIIWPLLELTGWAAAALPRRAGGPANCVAGAQQSAPLYPQKQSAQQYCLCSAALRIRGEEVGPDQRMSMISVAGLLQVGGCSGLLPVGWGALQHCSGCGCPGLKMFGSARAGPPMPRAEPRLRASTPACRRQPATTLWRCGAAAPRALPATLL